jgi:hypothetical protein
MEPFVRLSGSLFLEGEGQGQDLVGLGVLFPDKPGNAMARYAGFARAGASHDEERAAAAGDGG